MSGRLIEEVSRAAKLAAREAVDDALVAREAAEAVVEKLEDRLLKGRLPDEPVAWGRTVGRREALRLGKKRKALRGGPRPPAVRPARQHGVTTFPACSELWRILRGRRHRLTAKQSEAVGAVLEHGSIKGAARALGRDPSGLRKLFRRAVDRLRCS